MKRCAILCALLLSTSAFAEKIDLSTSTCKQFLDKDDNEKQVTLTWLDGYYKEENDPPVIDTDKFVANAKKLGDYGRKNLSLGLITATDKLFSK